VVATRPDIQLNAYEQKPLTRAFGIAGRGGADLFDTASQSSWAVFNFNIRIVGPQKEKTLVGGAQTEFPAFSIEAPAGFSAIATAVTNADISSSTRSVSSAAPNIWGNILTDNAPFNDEAGSISAGRVIALELGVRENEPMPVLNPGEKLVIKPKSNNIGTRSLNGYESTTIPYGYDEETQLYFPIGYEAPDGDVYVTQLPLPTGGSLVDGAVTTRSIGGSIKMYFKKLLRLPANTFTLHLFTNDQWQQVTDREEIKKQLSLLHHGQKLPLVVHGIFGDTKGMLEGLKEDSGFATNLPAILTYDFENLNTKVPDTATALKKELEKVGIGRNNVPKVTIIAHSMGGLVSRWLIEQIGGDTLVEKFIMAGTPNGGSEWSQASKYILNGAGFLLTHALNVTGPIKYAITGIGFFIKKLHDPQATLKDMAAGSPVIDKLASSIPPPAIPYLLIGSDTALLKEAGENDAFLKKVKGFLMGKILFPGLDKALFHQMPNDMAVTIDSMKKISGFDNVKYMQVFPGDHISYFSDEATRKAILALANS
jgi:triacylglycerol esterase/lipase EstA (alpha/beta hydrolase family)